MRTMIRAGLGAAAALAALALSGSALAAISPRLVVDSGVQGSAKTLTIGARVGQNDDWVGRLQVYVPSGYTLPATGALHGTVAAQAIATEIGPSNIIKLSGSVAGASSSDAAGVSWATTNCDNTAHADTWMIQLTGGSDNWSIPVFLDNTTGSETQFGAQKLVMCFGPREPGTTNPQSNKLLSLSVTLNGVVSPSSAGDYLWRSLWTPLGSGDTLDQSGAVEAQSTVHVQPAVLTIAAKKHGTHVVLTGKLLFGGEPMDGVRVLVKHGSTSKRLVSLAGVKTSSTGVWTLGTKVKKPQWFQAGATIGESDLAGGSCKASFGVPCVSATVGGTALSSRLIHVK